MLVDNKLILITNNFQGGFWLQKKSIVEHLLLSVSKKYLEMPVNSLEMPLKCWKCSKNVFSITCKLMTKMQIWLLIWKWTKRLEIHGNATGNAGNAFPPRPLDYCCQRVKTDLTLSAASPTILMIKVVNSKNKLIKIMKNW